MTADIYVNLKSLGLSDHTLGDINEVILCGFERMDEPFGVGSWNPKGLSDFGLKIREFKPIKRS